MQRIGLVLFGWLLGLATLWTVMAVSGGWYTYTLFGESQCRSLQHAGVDFAAGIEIVPNQTNPCYHRYARLRFP